MPKISVVFALLIAMLFTSQEGGFPAPEKTELEVTFLNVGVCDGILIRMNGESVFIDGGSYPEGEFCRNYLLNAGVKRLKYYIGTHSHSDHVGDAAITRIGPESYIRIKHYNDIQENENSLILRVSLGDISFILTADTSSHQLFKLLEKDENILNCTVIKGPHHGGGFHRFIFKYMKADYIVYSTSSISPPKPDQQKLAEAMAKRVFITGDRHDGAVTFLTDGKQLAFSAANDKQE